MSKGLNKQKIEAIFPLNTAQQGLLFHSLSSTFDQGFLNLQCDLRGVIDPDIFTKAWNKCIQRHAILRTTVHWEKIEKPVQIVHKKKEVVLEVLDWTTFSETEIDKQWEYLKDRNRKNGVDFTKGALLHVRLVQFGIENYRLLWTNHHLLLDGWSSNIILKEVFSYYEALASNASLVMEPLPSFKSYLRWLGQKNSSDAEDYWTDYFSRFRNNHLFNRISSGEAEKSSTIEKKITNGETDALKAYAKQAKVTLNTVIQGIWSLVLCRYFDSNDVMHGTTVSGRTSDFTGMSMLTGMFSKVHPVRNSIENNEELLSEWFAKIQKRQIKASSFEYLDLEDLMSFTDKDSKKPFFDSLLIFENYPVVDTSDKGISVTNFKSGVTSTYPITVTVLPGNEIHLAVTVSGGFDNNEKAEWLFRTFRAIVKTIVSNESESVSGVISELNPYTEADNFQDSPSTDQVSPEYIAPRNETEKQITEIWGEIFGVDKIGIHDNFFALGGKSMLAVKLFNAINQKMGTKLYPTTLMEHPTIAALSNLLSNDVEPPVFKYLVPIQSEGKKTPLFCVHGGGAHVFFFNPLANAVSSGRPVYALQPQGIYDDSKMHRSIAEMAADYAAEIHQVQPNGPYNILVYCFSTAVGIEMASAFKKRGQETNMIIVDSIIDQEDFTDPDRVRLRVSGFLSRIARNPFRAIKMGYDNHIGAFVNRKKVDFFGTEDERNLESVKRNLIKIYNDYDWKTAYKGQIALLLTRKDDNTLNDVYIKLWEQISEQEVKVVHVEGQHHELFEEPFVVSMSKTIEELIS